MSTILLSTSTLRFHVPRLTDKMSNFYEFRVDEIDSVLAEMKKTAEIKGDTEALHQLRKVCFGLLFLSAANGERDFVTDW